MTVTPPAESVEAPTHLADRFRRAMASYPSGVTIATTADDDGRWWGFTATSFCSVSMNPPLVLVCLLKTAQSHPAFLAARSWAVHLIGAGHDELARRFAVSGGDKFTAHPFTANASGDPVLAGTCAVLDCRVYGRHDGGDHTILVGEVTGVQTLEQPPVIYFRHGYHTLPTVAD